MNYWPYYPYAFDLSSKSRSITGFVELPLPDRISIRRSLFDYSNLFFCSDVPASNASVSEETNVEYGPHVPSFTELLNILSKTRQELTDWHSTKTGHLHIHFGMFFNRQKQADKFYTGFANYELLFRVNSASCITCLTLAAVDRASPLIDELSLMLCMLCQFEY